MHKDPCTLQRGSCTAILHYHSAQIIHLVHKCSVISAHCFCNIVCAPKLAAVYCTSHNCLLKVLVPLCTAQRCHISVLHKPCRTSHMHPAAHRNLRLQFATDIVLPTSPAANCQQRHCQLHLPHPLPARPLNTTTAA